MSTRAAIPLDAARSGVCSRLCAAQRGLGNIHPFTLRRQLEAVAPALLDRLAVEFANGTIRRPADIEVAIAQVKRALAGGAMGKAA